MADICHELGNKLLIEIHYLSVSIQFIDVVFTFLLPAWIRQQTFPQKTNYDLLLCLSVFVSFAFANKFATIANYFAHGVNLNTYVKAQWRSEN